MTCSPVRCDNGKCRSTGECVERRAPVAGFTDANDRSVRPGDEVEYRFGARRGELLHVERDGDARVRFFDTKLIKDVKFKNLCGVPPEFATRTLPVVASPPLAPATPRTIIAFTGLAGSGKSTAAAHLVNRYGYTRVRFAGPLKAMLAALGCTPDEIDGHLKETPCDLLCGKTPRQAMQWLGTEFGRDMIGPDLWIRAWKAALARTSGPVVVDDCRFPNEAAAIRAAGGVMIRIERPGAGAGAAGHSSEGQQLPAAATIHNTTSEKGLLYAVDELVSDLGWRDVAESMA